MKTHGGKRKGAGRKKLPKKELKVRVVLFVRKADVKALKEYARKLNASD